MNIIDNTPAKSQVLGIQGTQQNVVYRGEQSGRFYFGLSAANGGGSRYLAELSSGLLCWSGSCPHDTTFAAVEADVVIKN